MKKDYQLIGLKPDLVVILYPCSKGQGKFCTSIKHHLDFKIIVQLFNAIGQGNKLSPLMASR
ncbi:MAG: hypothetical protein ISR83_02260 [Candidatus Marinimicrobia bacterium]|nr:hypothetical protein [Candidatus Neomarinimicrobiota bacterium]